VTLAGADLDLARMRRERRVRLAAAMARQQVPALLLLGRANVQYATGWIWSPGDAGRAHQEPTIALVSCDDELPHLFTLDPASVPADLDAAHVHPGLHPECDAGVAVLAERVRAILGARAQGRLGLDEATAPMHLRLAEHLPRLERIDAVPVLSEARVCKTRDEVECLRRAQEINDRAMVDVQAALRPGMRPFDLTGLFLRRVFELGASGNVVDPIWQAMPDRVASGPRSVNGDVVFPLPSAERELREGGVLWVDTGISYEGYVSDFGRTWIVGRDPSDAQRALFRRWREVVERVLGVLRAGATASDLTAAALAGEPRPPWLRHLYLAHGAGLDSAEAPLVGTDLGDAFDRTLRLEAGMVVVLEPVVWVEGVGGFRAEETFVLTSGGWERLSDHRFAPFD
jgi:Xaa-Pro aminopeptidase